MLGTTVEADNRGLGCGEGRRRFSEASCSQRVEETENLEPDPWPRSGRSSRGIHKYTDAVFGPWSTYKYGPSQGPGTLVRLLTRDP